MQSGGSCPPPPSNDEVKDAATQALNAMDASSKCKSAFNMATRNKELTMAGGGLSLFPPIAGGGSGTSTDNQLKESLTREGCGSVYANISQQISSTQNILCTLNSSSNTTSVSGSANASVSIVQKPLTALQEKQNEAVINSIKNPELPKPVPGVSDDVYKALLDAYNSTVESNNEIKALIAESPNVNITNSTIKNIAGVDFKVITNTSKVNTTKLVEQATKVAKAQAEQKLQQKTGFGGNNPQVKQLIENKIQDKTQSITTSINSAINNVSISGSSSTGFKLEAYGNINIDNVVIDQYAQTRIIANSIMTIATNMGKDVANSVIQDSTSAASASTDTTGAEAALKEIYDGFAKTVKANADAAKGVLDSIGSIFSFGLMGMLLIGAVVLMVGPKILPGKSQGIIGIILSAILIYLIVAWFMSWWPFHKDSMIEQPMPPSSGIRRVKVVPYQFKYTGKHSGIYTNIVNEKETKTHKLI